MKRVATWVLPLAVISLLSFAAISRAEELRSGPQPGEMLGAYEVTKVAGRSRRRRRRGTAVVLPLQDGQSARRYDLLS